MILKEKPRLELPRSRNRVETRWMMTSKRTTKKLEKDCNEYAVIVKNWSLRKPFPGWVF
jgi:hypothetical protein